MSTEQPAEGSVEAALSAMDTKFFGAPEPEAAEAEPEEVEAEQPEQPEDEPAEDADLVEIDLGDGEVVRGPQKLKDAVERQRDYTVKTQELSVQRKAVEDRAQYVEAREKLISTVQDEIGEYKALQAQLKQYETLDWDALFAANQGQGLNLQRQQQLLERQIAEKSQAIQQKAQHAQAMQAQHLDQQWKLAAEGAKQRIGKFTAQDDLAMAQQARALGFEDAEIKAKLADSRILHALYKAAKWDSLQASKPEALKGARNAPPVIKPGAASPETSAKMRELNWSKQMKNAKTERDRRTLAEAKLTRFFGS